MTEMTGAEMVITALADQGVEHLFGFILVGLALYFLDPVVPNNLMTRILPYYAAAVGIYLGFFSREGRSWRPFFVLRSALGVIAVAALRARDPGARPGAGSGGGLLPIPQRQGDTAYINFDFQLQRAAADADEHFSSRPRAEAA